MVCIVVLLKSFFGFVMKYFGIFLGHLEVVKLLVSQGSDKSCKDKRGYTPLHAAAASGHVDVVKYLLRNGAEVRNSTFKCCERFFKF